MGVPPCTTGPPMVAGRVRGVKAKRDGHTGTLAPARCGPRTRRGPDPARRRRPGRRGPAVGRGRRPRAARAPRPGSARSGHYGFTARVAFRLDGLQLAFNDWGGWATIWDRS